MPDTQFPEQKQLFERRILSFQGKNSCLNAGYSVSRAKTALRMLQGCCHPKSRIGLHTARQKHTHFYTHKKDQIYNATLRRSVCTVSNSDVTAALPIGTLSLRYVMELYTVLRAEV